MKVYSPAEVAQQLNIKTATLRKYAIMLEDQGYTIERNSKRHRYYRDKDVITLRNVMKASHDGKTLREAVKHAVQLKGHNSMTNDTNNAELANHNATTELKEMIHKQNELIYKLTERLDQQAKQIDQQEQRSNERDQKLMQTLNEIRDTKQIEQRKQKGFFSRLFNRHK